MDKNYTQDIAKSTFWTTSSFIITSVIGFASSIMLTRYLGIDQYGTFGYFMWAVATLSLFANPGISQVVVKYLPEYFFHADQNKRHLCKKLFKYLLAAQISITLIIIALLLINPAFISRNVIHFPEQNQNILLTLTIAALAPIIMNNFLLSVLRAIQRFRIVSILQTLSQILWIGGIIIVVFAHLSLNCILLLFIATNTLLLIALILSMRSGFLPQQIPSFSKESLPLKKIITYSTWGFLILFLGTIVWEKSELYFLGLYSTPQQIAIYTIAFSLGIYLTSLFTPLITVINNITSQLIGLDQYKKLKFMSQYLTKYLAIIVIPISIILVLYMKHIILILYGKDFIMVSTIFPFLIFSQIAPLIFNPVTQVPTLSNEIHKMAYLGFGTAILNVTLNILLIPAYHALGAAIASGTAQVFAMGWALLLIRKYQLNIFNNAFLRVLGLNGLLFLFLITLHFIIPSLAIKIILQVIVCFIYLKLIIRYTLNQNDIDVFHNIFQLTPKLFQPFLRNIITKTMRIM